MPFGQQQYVPTPPPIGNFYQSPTYPPSNTLMGGPYGPNSQPVLPWLDSRANSQLPFLAALDIPKIHKLTNDPINHNHSGLWYHTRFLLTSQISMGNKGTTKPHTSLPFIYGLYPIPWWMIVFGFDFFPSPLQAMLPSGILNCHVPP